MSRPTIYKVLENPSFYDFSQLIIATGGSRALGKAYLGFADDITDRVLDVGCGPRLRTPANGKIMVGADINRNYLRHYVRQTDGPLFSGVAASANKLPFNDESFTECRTACVFHHLERELVIPTIREMYRVLKTGKGRLIVLDMVYPRVALTNPYAYLICRYDRGEHVLTEQGFMEALTEAIPGPWAFKPFRYSLSGLRGMAACLCK
jgi:ubiquinone/menaquinone biosynthesis C-methylase UbiE